jgi:hypothetical protein
MRLPSVAFRTKYRISILFTLGLYENKFQIIVLIINEL